VLAVAATMAVPVLGLASPAGAASGGNSANSHACENDGWRHFIRADGTPFANQGDCVSYAAQGGTLTVPSRVECAALGGTFVAGTGGTGSGTTLWECNNVTSPLPEGVQFDALFASCVADGGSRLEATEASPPESYLCAIE
jgi:hypothetical protein